MEEESIKKIKLNAKKDFSYRLNETGDYRDTWKIFRIMAEFVEGYQFLTTLEDEVVILGSARFDEDDEYYKIARELGNLLGKGGYSTLTGGGPGIMEAANRGAHEVKGKSVGINIQLPFEQRINPYVDKSTAFYYFFTRKVMLTSPAHAFVYFPGGFGTMDEFFEVVDHVELGKMCHIPVVLVGKKYWEPLLHFVRESAVKLGTIAPDHIDAWHVVDTAQEAYAIVEGKGLSVAERQACELSALSFHTGSKNIDWRVFQIMAELVEGFEFLTGMVEDVSVLGTKSLTPDSTYYDAAYSLGRELGNTGIITVTGGARGVAEAANKGAMEVGGESYGIGMVVNGKQRMNDYVNKSIIFEFPFTRKLILTAPSKAFVFFPGGLGTLHQLFEVLTLIQTEKMQKIPIILFDHAFWGPLHQFIKKTMVHDVETVADEDDELYQIVDSVESAMNIITTFRNSKVSD